MDRKVDFFDRVLVFARDGQLVDHLGRMRAHDMRAEDLAVFLVPKDLDEAFRLARAARPPVGGEGKPPRHVIELLLLALIFGQSDARHLRVAIRHAGHIVVLDRVGLLARDDFGDH